MNKKKTFFFSKNWSIWFVKIWLFVVDAIKQRKSNNNNKANHWNNWEKCHVFWANWIFIFLGENNKSNIFRIDFQTFKKYIIRDTEGVWEVNDEKQEEEEEEETKFYFVRF